MTNEPSPLKDAIMDAVYTPLERDDMQTPCTLPFMTSSSHGVCDGDGCPVSDESIASALNAVAKIQTEYYKVKKETQKGNQMNIKLDAYAYPDSGMINGTYDPEEPTPDNPVRRPFLVPSTRFKGEWRWQPTIDVETGTILDWPKGTVAEIYDKSSDDCAVIVNGRNLNDGEYVPAFLRPGHNDDDYLVMSIDGEGRIAGWNAAKVKAWIDKRQRKAQ